MLGRLLFGIASAAGVLMATAGCADAQSDCKYFPADCPDDETIQFNASKKWEGPADLKVEQEYLMQDSLRRFVGRMMTSVAQQNGWTWYWFNEVQDGGIGIDGNTRPLPYALRRPCRWEADIVFIVNADSLAGWREWYNTALHENADEVVNAYKQAANGDEASASQDSAMYYANLKAKYMTDHAAEYQKAILSGDKKAQKKFEDESRRFDDRMNGSVNDAIGRQGSQYADANRRNEQLQSFRLSGTVAHRNASVLRVSFVANDDYAGAFSYEREENARLAKTAKPAPAAAGSSLAITEHNEHPGNEWGQGSDVALVLFGKWNTNADADQLYHAGFTADPKNTDHVTVKKMSCDRVQSISLRIEGDPVNIRALLGKLDAAAFAALVVR